MDSSLCTVAASGQIPKHFIDGSLEYTHHNVIDLSKIHIFAIKIPEFLSDDCVFYDNLLRSNPTPALVIESKPTMHQTWSAYLIERMALLAQICA